MSMQSQLARQIQTRLHFECASTFSELGQTDSNAITLVVSLNVWRRSQWRSSLAAILLQSTDVAVTIEESSARGEHQTFQ